ncbi:uncharacterized protein BX664DRAFT_130315 [Halteromyces radiatus]|uniref:uncharacterized protein n=1 Tax=Halteromyces radiatus TaxID=101107 RepID=UPI00222045D8|nr:uncharacterized protein BX664DRAFT_130315 [Halteromyces radiatus]KAI8089258.1 hypothetical protein BX664DRAFT_130315 [Halteromyces radiatus]
MVDVTCHSFDTCPLRSSSLLIVHHDQQVIVTASDEVFDMLGYQASQLVNKPLSLLSLSTINNEKRQHYTKTRHATTKQWVKLTMCVHHDPFSMSSGLDYCLLAPTETLYNNNNNINNNDLLTSVSLVGLNSYGTIVHAYPATQFPQTSSLQLVGRPIMSFIHTDDVRPLCRLLRKSTTSTNNGRVDESVEEHTMEIRWLQDATNERFEWMKITIVNPTMYNQLSTLNGQPICLLRPTTTSHYTMWHDIWYSLENGRIYCMEFAQHLLACLVTLVKDIVSTYYTSSSPSLSLSSKESGQSPLSHIKVNDGVSIHLIPLVTRLNTNSDSLYYLISSFLNLPISFFPDRALLDLLKPILPQSKSPSSP